jgi:cystathionine beta-synthase
MIYNSIVDTIGNTPIVRLNNMTKGIPGTILAKVEYFNPGNSTKDRMALK